MPPMALWLLGAESAKVTLGSLSKTVAMKGSHFWCRLRVWILRS